MLRVHLESAPQRFKARIVGHLSNEDNLLEVKRLDLIRLAKETNRYQNKVTSGITVIGINTDELLSRSSDHLDVKFDIHGYESIIRFENFIPILQGSYSSLLSRTKSELSKNQMKSVITRAVYTAIDSSDIKILCSCPDFTYRFAYTATVGGYKLGAPESRPATKTNPKNVGSMCKHLSSVIGVVSKWQKRVVSDIYKIIQWDESILTKK